MTCHHWEISVLVSQTSSLWETSGSVAKCRVFSQENKRAVTLGWGPGGGTLGISGWGCATGTLEPLTYTRASSAEFCYPILG